MASNSPEGAPSASFDLQNQSDVARLAERALLALLAIGPLVSLISATASDVWLCVFIAVAIGRRALSPTLARWGRLRDDPTQSWAIVAAALAAWFLLRALFTPDPLGSTGLAVAWARFPLFALLLALVLSEDERRFRVFFQSTVLAVAIMAGVVLVQRLSDLDALRLTGTFSKPKPGWLLYGFGLPAALILAAALHERMKTGANGARPGVSGSGTARPAALAFLLAPPLGSFAAGEVYMTFSILLGYGLFFVVRRLLSAKVLAIAAAGVAAAALVAQIAPYLTSRFTTGALARLPWRETSDYRDPWWSGLWIGSENWLFGVGPGRFDPVCEAAMASGALDVEKCLGHPHQLYLQVFAETGVVGLAGLVLLAAALVRATLVGRGDRPKGLSAGRGVALVLIVVALLPIGTYSDAFSQHRNFFTWIMIAWALALVRRDREDART